MRPAIGSNATRLAGLPGWGRSEIGVPGLTMIDVTARDAGVDQRLSRRFFIREARPIQIWQVRFDSIPSTCPRSNVKRLMFIRPRSIYFSRFELDKRVSVQIASAPGRSINFKRF